MKDRPKESVWQSETHFQPNLPATYVEGITIADSVDYLGGTGPLLGSGLRHFYAQNDQFWRSFWLFWAWVTGGKVESEGQKRPDSVDVKKAAGKIVENGTSWANFER